MGVLLAIVPAVVYVVEELVGGGRLTETRTIWNARWQQSHVFASTHLPTRVRRQSAACFTGLAPQLTIVTRLLI